MIEIIKELNIEVSKPNVFQAVVAKQYDMNTRFIKATFVDGADKIFIDPEATVTVVINALRPDGESKGFDGVVNEDGTVTVPLHSWMLELVGTVICDISVIDTEADDNKKLTTTSFTLLVEKAAFGGSDITSDPQYDVLVTLLETCSEASVAAEEALQKSMEANSKYDACVEATANANAVREEIEAGGYIESLKEINNGSKFSTWIGTKAEYDALTEKPLNCLCIITDDPQSDYVVEQGTDGIWTYRKWASGIAECWGKTEIQNADISFPWGAGYTVADEEKEGHSKQFYFIFPTGLFTEVNAFHTDIFMWGHFIQAFNMTIDKNEATACLYAVVAYSESYPIDCHVSAKGRWK